MAAVGMMHNLSKTMVIPYSGGDGRLTCTALGVRMHAYKTYKTSSKYRVHKFMDIPVL
jgi:hypothetical protein